MTTKGNKGVLIYYEGLKTPLKQFLRGYVDPLSWINIPQSNVKPMLVIQVTNISLRKKLYKKIDLSEMSPSNIEAEDILPRVPLWIKRQQGISLKPFLMNENISQSNWIKELSSYNKSRVKWHITKYIQFDEYSIFFTKYN